ncbi:Protein of unknown function, partial [Cotesia congregata]
AVAIVGNNNPTIKLPPQLQILPTAIAVGRGDTSNNSEPINVIYSPLILTIIANPINKTIRHTALA